MYVAAQTKDATPSPEFEWAHYCVSSFYDSVSIEGSGRWMN